MEPFLVSARKYRPATFRSVVGQEQVTATLRNAIARGQLAHAYLFCGPRGVGKTTCARIFAKAINCLSPHEAEACNACESCRSFDEGRSFNIHELDAASNNSVDDIRNLTDQVRVPPQVGRYSVYIIDEVHMLSAAAFNAFLKTLEEPPRHAVFILATTEKHKIIPTILSRCQIFDFNRIRVEDSVGYLRHIAGEEGIEADDESLNLIARKADGAMRDALSMFDKAVSFCGSELRLAEVARSLNVLDYDTYFRMADLVQQGSWQEALVELDRVLAAGFGVQTFAAGLASHLRDLAVCRESRTAGLLEATGSLAEHYAAQAARMEMDFLFDGMELLAELDGTLRTATHPRFATELALMRLAGLGQKKKGEPIAAPLPDLSASSSAAVSASPASPLPSAPAPAPAPASAPSSATGRPTGAAARPTDARERLSPSRTNRGPDTVTDADDGEGRIVSLEKGTGARNEPSRSRSPETPEPPGAEQADRAATLPVEQAAEPSYRSGSEAAPSERMNGVGVEEGSVGSDVAFPDREPSLASDRRFSSASDKGPSLDSDRRPEEVTEPLAAPRAEDDSADACEPGTPVSPSDRAASADAATPAAGTWPPAGAAPADGEVLCPEDFAAASNAATASAASAFSSAAGGSLGEATAPSISGTAPDKPHPLAPTSSSSTSSGTDTSGANTSSGTHAPSETGAAPPRRKNRTLSGAPLAEILGQAPLHDPELEPAEPLPVYDPEAAAKIAACREAFLTRLQQERPRLAVALSDMRIEGHTLHLRVASDALRDEVIRNQTELLGELAARAGVQGSLEMAIEVCREPYKAPRPVKPEEKWRYMIEKNPSLAELRRMLDLETE